MVPGAAPTIAAVLAKLVAVILALFSAAAQPASLAFVSNAVDGRVRAYRLDEPGKALTPTASAPAGSGVMATVAGRSGRRLYALTEAAPFHAQAFDVKPRSGRLRSLGKVALPAGMVDAVVDRSGRWLIATSYERNLIAVMGLDADGRFTARPAQVVPSGGVRPHAVRLSPDGRSLYVPHLGSDEIRIYPFDAARGAIDTGTVRSVPMAVGTGPRHLAFSPDGRFVYVLGELSGDVLAYARDLGTGALAPVQRVSSLPADSGLTPRDADPRNAIWCADIHVTPDGRFLYTSERTRSMLSRFTVDGADGRIRWLGEVRTERQPRGFAIDPSGRFLVASGERSARLSLYRIGAHDGALTLIARSPTGHGANWVTFVRSQWNK